jgi:hypothetical protein
VSDPEAPNWPAYRTQLHSVSAELPGGCRVPGLVPHLQLAGRPSELWYGEDLNTRTLIGNYLDSGPHFPKG